MSAARHLLLMAAGFVAGMTTAWLADLAAARRPPAEPGWDWPLVPDDDLDAELLALFESLTDGGEGSP